MSSGSLAHLMVVFAESLGAVGEESVGFEVAYLSEQLFDPSSVRVDLVDDPLM